MIRVANLHPAGDLIEHEMNEDCVCGPEVRWYADGGRLIIHFSLDGREENEDDE